MDKDMEICMAFLLGVNIFYFHVFVTWKCQEKWDENSFQWRQTDGSAA